MSSATCATACSRSESAPGQWRRRMWKSVRRLPSVRVAYLFYCKLYNLLAFLERLRSTRCSSEGGRLCRQPTCSTLFSSLAILELPRELSTMKSGRDMLRVVSREIARNHFSFPHELPEAAPAQRAHNQIPQQHQARRSSQELALQVGTPSPFVSLLVRFVLRAPHFPPHNTPHAAAQFRSALRSAPLPFHCTHPPHCAPRLSHAAPHTALHAELRAPHSTRRSAPRTPQLPTHSALHSTEFSVAPRR